ncbi:cytochrome P450 [Cucurbitaria berberidis CBS 394.84]|uniref:Cytochrome P450 n=1 Tax=Cucurbitaria berberidis CBS 394.84 TaxID=1168544 RepID=A0A9P4LES2_9PLEO|nr:cytochrome P450 [Cucurbitaria berberidis CBS 394.84]KAF1852233.1 cytochrome P450 [Cucurbitaria berberidis CBS 394.84]
MPVLYCKANIPFIVPTLESGPTVVLPQQQIKAVYGLPEDVLGVHRVQDETMQLHWVFPDAHLLAERLQFNVIRNQLTQNIPKIIPRVAAEIDFGFSRSWGNDTGWKEVRVWTSTLRIVAGAANGVFCGPPLCRDIVFLDRMKDHAMTIFAGALVLNCFPKSLFPVFGPVLSLVSGFMEKRAMEKSMPVVEKRLVQTARWKSEPACEWAPPDDALQWIIDECYTSKNPDAQLHPKRVSQRLLFVNDVSMLTTAYTAQNFILDIFSTDPSLGYVDILRQECKNALSESNGKWSPEAVKKLRLVDSAIRESMRMNPFGTLTLPREVVHPGGIRVDNWDVCIPNHTRIALPTEAIHYDNSIYSDAHRYDPFRFAHLEDYESSQVKSTVTLDDSFLAFGVPGRWACPGRFFALLELKIFVANMLLDYEIGYLKKRPSPIYLLWARYPPDVRIWIRRRY